jgi:hypothetical protein
MPSAATDSGVNLFSARNVQCFVETDFFLAWRPFSLDGESAVNSPLSPASSPCLGPMKGQSVLISNVESMMQEAVVRASLR